MHALQLYAPKTDPGAYAQAIQKAAAWILKAKPKGNDDRAWRLAGLAWGGQNKEATQQALRELLATQKPDGGWSDIDSMESGAYATGRALYALHAAGLSASHPAYEHGVEFLLKTQQEDGSWFVQSRAMTFQPYFDSGFPHGYNQWISAAGTSWATLALTQAATAAKTTVAAR
jgi:squalene cyclase